MQQNQYQLQQQQLQQQQNQQQQQPIDSIFDESYSQIKQMWIPFTQEEYDQLNDSEMIFSGRMFQKNSKSKKWQFFHFELYCDKLIRVGDTEETQFNTLDFKNSGNYNSDHEQDVIIKNQDDQDIAQPSNENNVDNNSNNNKRNSKDNLNRKQSQENIGFDLRNIEVIQKNNFKDQDKFYLLLNCCFLKKIRYSDNVASNYKFGIRLQKDEVKCELFTENAQSFNKWYEEVKRYCLLSKFSKKYKILTKMKSLQQASSIYYKGFRFYDSIQYCIRVIDKFTLSDPSRQSLIKEVGILRRIDHPILLKLVEVYEDEVNVFIVLEIFHGKNLKSKMNEFICLDEKTVSDIMWKLLHGLCHVHSKNMVHRDIKLENIFFRNPNNLSDICLGGFQSSEVLKNKNVKQIQTKRVGTVGYMAPELFKDKAQYDQKIDVFSLGCVFHALVFGVLPFEEQDLQIIEKLNQQCKINFDKQPPFFKLSTSAKDLMQKMLDKNPNVRGTAQQLLNHTWFVNMRNKNYHEKAKHQNMMGFSSLSTIKENNSEFDNTYFQSSKLCNTISIQHNENMQFKLGSQINQEINEDQEENEYEDNDIKENSQKDPFNTQQSMKTFSEFEQDYDSIEQKMNFLNQQTNYSALNCHKKHSYKQQKL